MLVWLANAPALDLLVAPHERVLWPILVGVLLFGVAGLWVGRRDRGATGGPDAGDGVAGTPKDTRAD